MIDNVWYDWQCRDPVNVNSFFGGSAQHIESLIAYNQYPNGGPPYLRVRTYQLGLGAYLDLIA
jgi:tyrosinase